MKFSKGLCDKLLLGGIYVFGFITLSAFFQYFNLLPAIFYNSQMGTLGDILIGLAAYGYSKQIKQGNSNFILLFLGIIILMLVNGLYQTNSLRNFILSDLQLYIRFYLMIWIGYNVNAFEIIKKAMMLLLKIGIITSIISLFTTDTFLRELLETKPLAYKLQYILIPATFYLLIFDSLSKFEKITVATAFSIYFIEQILFQKRLPLARLLTCLGFFFYSMWLFKDSLNKINVSFVKRLSGVFSIVFIAATLITIIGFNIGIYSNALFDRFTGTNNGDDFEENLSEDPRWKIGEIFWDEIMFSNDLIIGRGLGGVVYHSSFPISEEEKIGLRTESEMGTATMLLKGGFLLISYFSIVLIIILFRFNRLSKSYLGFAHWSFVIIFFIFTHPEGFIVTIYSPQEMLVGYSIGACLSPFFSKIKFSTEQDEIFKIRN
jgi:hypothetical protein